MQPTIQPGRGKFYLKTDIKIWGTGLESRRESYESYLTIDYDRRSIHSMDSIPKVSLWERKPFGPKEFEKFSFSIKLFWIKLSAFNGCIRKRIGRASRDLNALGSLLLTNSRTVWWARCLMSMRRSLSALWLSSNVALVDYGSRPPRWLASQVVSHWRKNNRRNRSKCLMDGKRRELANNLGQVKRNSQLAG